MAHLKSALKFMSFGRSRRWMPREQVTRVSSPMGAVRVYVLVGPLGHAARGILKVEVNEFL